MMSVSTLSALISTNCLFKVIPFPTLEKTPDKTTGEMTGKTIGETPLAVLELLTADPGLTVSERAIRQDKLIVTIHKAVPTLRESSRLVRTGPDKGGHWKVLD